MSKFVTHPSLCWVHRMKQMTDRARRWAPVGWSCHKFHDSCTLGLLYILYGKMQLAPCWTQAVISVCMEGTLTSVFQDHILCRCFEHVLTDALGKIHLHMSLQTRMLKVRATSVCVYFIHNLLNLSMSPVALNFSYVSASTLLDQRCNYGKKSYRTAVDLRICTPQLRIIGGKNASLHFLWHSLWGFLEWK